MHKPGGMMHKLSKLWRGLILGFALALTVTLSIANVPSVAPAAQAATGGTVYLSSASTGSIKIAANYRSIVGPGLPPFGWLAPGQNSVKTAKFSDTDGFLTPANCTTTRKQFAGPGAGYINKTLKKGTWYKITGTTRADVTVKNCK